MYIRRGYDPRADSASLRYQSITLRLSSNFKVRKTAAVPPHPGQNAVADDSETAAVPSNQQQQAGGVGDAPSTSETRQDNVHPPSEPASHDGPKPMDVDTPAPPGTVPSNTQPSAATGAEPPAAGPSYAGICSFKTVPLKRDTVAQLCDLEVRGCC